MTTPRISYAHLLAKPNPKHIDSLLRFFEEGRSRRGTGGFGVEIEHLPVHNGDDTAVSYFKQKHDVNLNAQDADWTASYGGEKPVEWLTKQTIDTLRFRHAAYLIAVSYGLVDDDSYTGIVKRMETLNANNRQKREAGQVIYGRSEYDIASYIDYEMTALKNDYVDDATKPGMNPSETEVQEYYDAHDWTVDGVEGKAPLADVKANVKTALRTERYRERVQSKADKIDVSTLPWKRLYAYAATLIG